MKLVPYDVKKVKYYSTTKNLKIIKEFKESNLQCAKIEDFPHADARSCYSSLVGSIKRFGIVGVRVITSRGEVFLIKESE